MPRHADHEERRTQLADAALTIAAAKGLEAVTVAGVAAEAAVSVGLVQHYFPSKRALLEQAYQRSWSLALFRVADQVKTGERAGKPIRSMMTAALGELLPLDEQRRKECAVRTQFHGSAVTDDHLTAIAEAAGQQVRGQISQAIDNGRECGETDPRLDTDLAGWEVWCLTSGASAIMLHAQTPAEELLTMALQRVFPHSCRRQSVMMGQ